MVVGELLQPLQFGVDGGGADEASRAVDLAFIVGSVM